MGAVILRAGFVAIVTVWYVPAALLCNQTATWRLDAPVKSHCECLSRLQPEPNLKGLLVVKFVLIFPFLFRDNHKNNFICLSRRERERERDTSGLTAPNRHVYVVSFGSLPPSQETRVRVFHGVPVAPVLGATPLHFTPSPPPRTFQSAFASSRASVLIPTG